MRSPVHDRFNEAALRYERIIGTAIVMLQAVEFRCEEHLQDRIDVWLM
ncbi:MAG: hypothetical protein M3428_02440 [Pseudomonadota bacterium]|nr:hypothetical protein [Pseudomonadota bacterium]